MSDVVLGERERQTDALLQASSIKCFKGPVPSSCIVALGRLFLFSIIFFFPNIVYISGRLAENWC